GLVHGARVRRPALVLLQGDALVDRSPAQGAVPALPARDLAAVRHRLLMGAALPVGDPAPADGILPADLPIDLDVPLSMYLHVPFCRVRCGYCDFNTYTATELRGARQDQYADTLLREIALAREVLDAAH